MIRREIEAKWIEERWKDFRNPRSSEKSGLHKHSSALVSKIRNALLKHLGVSDVDFDPENGSRMVQVAKSEI